MCILSSPHISIYYSLTRARFRVCCLCVCVVRVFTAPREKRKKSRIRTKRRREEYVTQTYEYALWTTNSKFGAKRVPKLYLNPKSLVHTSYSRETIFIFVAQTRRGGSTFKVIFSSLHPHNNNNTRKRSIYIIEDVLFFTLRTVLSNICLLLVSVIKQSTTRDK